MAYLFIQAYILLLHDLGKHRAAMLHEDGAHRRIRISKHADTRQDTIVRVLVDGNVHKLRLADGDDTGHDKHRLSAQTVDARLIAADLCGAPDELCQTCGEHSAEKVVPVHDQV